jgi:Cu(I)/Ag(I) efflux system membrane fusion protein
MSPPATVAAAGQPLHQGEGRIAVVSKEGITFSHGPIASMKWPAMTMQFKLPTAPGQLPSGLKAGDSANFEFYMDKDGLPQLTRVWPQSATGGKS